MEINGYIRFNQELDVQNFYTNNRKLFQEKIMKGNGIKLNALLLTLMILCAANFPANAKPVTLTSDKGEYTIDFHAGTYKGCVERKCISLGSNQKVGEATWKNGEYKYVVTEEGVFVYKNQTLVFSDRLHTG
jgi:hypothetical protein